MGLFTDNVRNGKIKAPQQRGFLLSAWEASFEKLASDEDDKWLHKSGIWFAKEFDSIRELTKDGQRNFQWSSPRDRLSAFIGFSIWQWSVLVDHLRSQMKKSADAGGYFPTEADKLPVKGPFSKDIDAVGTIEILVDGLRYPLTIEHQEMPCSVKRGAGTLKELSAFMSLVHTGQYYHVLEQKWLDCLWNGHFVDDREKVTLIRFTNESLNKHEAISEFRRHSLASGDCNTHKPYLEKRTY